MLAKNGSPTAEDVKVGISGILCRCTGYYPIIQAIEEASEAKVQ
jgi:carbon-monoxide dehydrogenase small subunit